MKKVPASRITTSCDSTDRDRSSSRVHFLSASKEFDKIFLSAQSRWLLPYEICQILCSYRNLSLNPEPSYKPKSGSLYLFNRDDTRFFRKDGHTWRKKVDGKTIKEAHEKLKYKNVNILHCYYAHGGQNDRFQRRCYWLLNMF